MIADHLSHIPYHEVTVDLSVHVFVSSSLAGVDPVGATLADSIGVGFAPIVIR